MTSRARRLAVMIGCVLLTPQCSTRSSSSDAQSGAVTANGDGARADAGAVGGADRFRKREDVVTELLGGPSQYINPNTSFAERENFDSLFDTSDIAPDEPGPDESPENGTNEPGPDPEDGVELYYVNYDLRGNDTAVRDQGARPTCTSFAIAAVMENLANRDGNALDLSEEHIWALTVQYRGGASNGVTALSVVNRFAIVPETVWPYGSPRPGDISQAGVANTTGHRGVSVTAAKLQASLRQGIPIFLLVDVTRSFLENRTGVIDAKSALVQPWVRHALAVVGFQGDDRVGGGGYMIFKNSWGEGWGDRGYGYLPLDFCKARYCRAYAVTGVGLR